MRCERSDGSRGVRLRFPVRLGKGLSGLLRNGLGDVVRQVGRLLPQFPHGRGFPELSLEYRAERENLAAPSALSDR